MSPQPRYFEASNRFPDIFSWNDPINAAALDALDDELGTTSEGWLRGATIYVYQGDGVKR